MKILILGANGMFGSMIAHVLSQSAGLEVEQTVRSNAKTHGGMADVHTYTLDVLDEPALIDVLTTSKPDVVINCTGLIKQQADASDVLAIFPINGLFPHKLARLCAPRGIRVIQFSTDCIFSGQDGNYADDADCDAQDYYGMSKRIGEVSDMENVLTLRTSIIGHEAYDALQLVDWFLTQTGSVKGYANAIFTGFPTVTIGHILRDYVLPNAALCGVFNMSSDPISKLDLLRLISAEYDHQIDIIPDEAVRIYRSLNSSAFRAVTGYVPADWKTLVKQMHDTRPTF